MTKKETIKLHRELWTWIADNPGSEKSDWPEWRHNGGPIDKVYSWCFCCAYDDQLFEKAMRDRGLDPDYNEAPKDLESHYCPRCPVVWNDDPETVCDDDGASFANWRDAMDNRQYKAAQQFAKEIAEMPEREGV